MPEPAPPRRGPPASAIAAAIAAAMTVVVPMTGAFEGKRNQPYRDPVGVPTVCYGETAVPMVEYSDAECAAMLRVRAARDFAPVVIRAVPALVDPAHKGALAASTDFAYNVGVFGNTAMARMFRQGDWVGGCHAFTRYKYAHHGDKLVALPGLARRRLCEEAVCDDNHSAVVKLCPKTLWGLVT